MGEQTTFSLKAFAIFLLVLITFGVVNMFVSKFDMIKYDLFVVYGLAMLSFFFLISNNIMGWILPGVSAVWILFNPIKASFLEPGIIFQLIKTSGQLRLILLVETLLWVILLSIIIISIMMKQKNKRDDAFEISAGIYIILFSAFYLTGFLNGFLEGNFSASLALTPVFVLITYIILFYVGYLFEGHRE
ncbi:MAG: hypothetical protein WC755_05450 [Candidatus Woesearchaeota archaeon]|jgi:hypothetical protein